MKKVLFIVGGVLALVLIVPFLIFGGRALWIGAHINDDVSDLYDDTALMDAVMVTDTPTIKLSITCGYATIQWMTRFLGVGEVDEQKLYDGAGGKITTAFPNNFAPELNHYLGDGYRVTMLSNATNHEILKAIHASLKHGMPVPISFAAIDDLKRPNYTLHYSVVTGMDLAQDKVYVSNVYGYEEIYSVAEFLDSLKFDNYVDMPLFIRLGVLFGAFDKNTIYLVEKK